MSNERLAHWLARQAGHHCTREQVEDLAQTALLAMCRAAQLFDPTLVALIALCRTALGLPILHRCNPFVRYAGTACKRAIRDEMNERLGPIHLPRWLFRAGRADHPYQAVAAQARRVGRLLGDDDPESAQSAVDDHLDGEALLAWLDPADRSLILSYLGGETIRSIAERRGCARLTVRNSVGRILRELRGRASR